MDPHIAQMGVSPYPDHVPMHHHQQVQQQQQQQQQASASQPPVQQQQLSQQQQQAPPQDEVDDFLRRKRKAREHKACYPCRQRKVKCDLSRPCQTCRDREHPELCDYNPPNKRQSVDRDGSLSRQEDMGSGNYVTIGRAELDMLFQKLSNLEDSIASLRYEIGRNATDHNPDYNIDQSLEAQTKSNTPHPGPTPSQQQSRRHMDVHGMHTRNDAGDIVHLGGNSVPALLYALSQGETDHPHVRELIGKSVLPMLGLDNESSTYPFVDLWGLPHGSLARARELAKILPNDTELLSFFRCFKETGYVIFPSIVDPQALEQQLTMFLINRAAHAGTEDGVSEQMIYGRDYHWLGVLFAVLGLGAQCSSMARKERELTSQVYVCCAYECLRFVNFLSQANLEDIQTMLIVGNVMINNMNAGTAWAMLGLTIRLAQGLGLHRACPPNVPKEIIFPRSKIWWGIMWQDALLSITYDRASSSAGMVVITTPRPMTIGPIDPYHASMYCMSSILLDICKDRSVSLSTREMFHKIGEHRESIFCVIRDASDYLRDKSKCTTSLETLQYYGLQLHSSYALSEASRAAISPSTNDPETTKAYKQLCIDSLANCVEAWMGINTITSYSRQSWSALHRGLSSALLLGILGEHRRSDRVRELLGRFLAALAHVTNTVSPSELSAPVQRGVAALRKLEIQEARGPRFPNEITIAPSLDGTSISDDASLKQETSSVFTPASSSEAGLSVHEDYSPYSILNTILWGPREPHQSPSGILSFV